MRTSFLPKACTELISPVRVVQVARITKKKVSAAVASAQRLKMPRVRYSVIACSSAVAVSQGTSEVFSTGSQAQNPPKERTTYAHQAPRPMPSERKSQPKTAHFCDSVTQRRSARPMNSAARAKAKGTVRPT